MSARITLIHAVTVAMEPVSRAFASDWPEAEVVNLLEDSLAADQAAAGTLTPAMYARLRTLTRYAADIGSAGILFTCSAFGPAIEAARREVSVPVLKPNEAMFDDAIAAGGRIGMLATFEPSVALMEAEFREAAAQAGKAAELRTLCVPEAMAALKAGAPETHNRLLAEAAGGLTDCDAIMLAHFSTSHALESVRAAVEGSTTAPVLTSPGSAVRRLKSLLARASG